jgi:hypothetical protein
MLFVRSPAARHSVFISNVARGATNPVARQSHDAFCSLDYLVKCLKSLVVCAVLGEPVSIVKFPIITEFNRENLNFWVSGIKAKGKTDLYFS